MAPIPKPIRDWISQFFTEKGVPESSSDVDHDETSNRTHDGDDLTPATLRGADLAGAAADSVLTAQGGGGLSMAPAGVDYQEFTTSGTWNKPSGVEFVVVYLVGGGASGSTSFTNGGSGGGGFVLQFDASDLESSVSVEVGAGGDGSGGGNSGFADITAQGGQASGPGGSIGGFPGGADEGGDGIVSGGGGSAAPGGRTIYGGGGGGGSGGVGGSSVLGGDGGDGGSTNPGNGGFPGGGGGGGDGSAYGIGADGVVRVWSW